MVNNNGQPSYAQRSAFNCAWRAAADRSLVHREGSVQHRRCLADWLLAPDFWRFSTAFIHTWASEDN